MSSLNKAGLALALLMVVLGEAGAAQLSGKAQELQPFLGTWEVKGRWSFGQDLWARSVYYPGPGGQTVLSRVLVKDGDGVPYVRYTTVLAYDNAKQTWMAHSTHHDGKVTSAEFALDGAQFLSEWKDGDNLIRDRTWLQDDGTLGWVVTMTPDGSDATQTLLDTAWHRVKQAGHAAPIDSNLFVSEGESSFVVEADVDAPVELVYAAWTDPKAFRESYAPESQTLVAQIDLAVGGRYEILWDGVTGSNDCQILAFIPNHMISFSWNAPPEQKDSRAQRTWVVVEFDATAGGRTHVRLTHLGFGRAEHWEETKAYFQKAWPHVLAQFAKNLAAAHRDAAS